MRVIAGSRRGRLLKSVPGMGTRPTADRVKESMFNIIGPFFDGGRGLDLFAGAGGLGIEGLSRGLDEVWFVDHNPLAVRTIRHNLRQLELEDQARLLLASANKAISLLSQKGQAFDLVWMDPPYSDRQHASWLAELLHKKLLHSGATVVVEHQANLQLPEEVGGLARYRQRLFGHTALSIYRLE